MSSSLPIAVVNRKGEDRVRNGHPWIYKSDVVSSAAAPGDLVRVLNERKRTLGVALWSSRSLISLRFMSFDSDVADERAFFAERLQAALAYRDGLSVAGNSNVSRLVSSEGDRLPGLVVDSYADHLVVQTLSEGMDRRLPMLVELLAARKPLGILARNDPKVRALEGLDEQVEVLHGEIPDEFDVIENDLTFRIDVKHGQKTGMFLDQRENHFWAAQHGHGRALDAFTYNGGFAMNMARTGATSVLAIDSSAAAVAVTRANAERNGLKNIEVREANVFDELRELEIAGERFDTVVLDPPAFAKNKASVPKAAAGYKEINLRALKLLNPGGTLITCSCSYAVSEELFREIVEQAAADARATVALVEKRQQARDHPVLLNVPETHYLKCLILRKM